MNNETANRQERIDANALATYGDVNPHFRLLSAMDLAIYNVEAAGSATGDRRKQSYANAAAYAEIAATISWAQSHKRS